MTKTSASLIRGIALGALVLASPVRASVVVDWLALAGGGSASGFSLVDDGSTVAVTGSLEPDFGAGLVFPGYPSARTFGAGFWTGAPGFIDSLTGDASIAGTAFRVVPQSGAAAFSLELHLRAGQPCILAIGGLFRDAGGATAGVEVEILADSGGVAYVESAAWSNGITSLVEPVLWDGSSVTTVPGSSGDSEFAFLSIGPLTGADPVVRLRVADGYAEGTGDEITVAVGYELIPEPASSMLLLLGGGVLLSRRRRDGGRG